MSNSTGVVTNAHTNALLESSPSRQEPAQGQQVNLGGVQFRVWAPKKDMQAAGVSHHPADPMHDLEGTMVNKQQYTTLRDRAVSREKRQRAVKWTLGGAFGSAAVVGLAFKLGVLAAALSNPLTASIVGGVALIAVIVYAGVAIHNTLKGGESVRQHWNERAGAAIDQRQQTATLQQQQEETLNGLRTQQEQALKDLRTTLGNLQKELLTGVQNTVAKEFNKIADDRKNNGQQHAGLDAMAQQLTQVSEQVTTCNTTIGQVLNQISQDGDKQAFDQESLRGVNNQLQKLETAVEQLKQQMINKENGQQDAMTQRLDEVSEQVKACNKTIGQVLKQISQDGGKQAIAQKSLDDVKNELQGLKSAVEKLQQHTGLEVMTKQLNQVSEQVKAYNTEIVKLRNQISQDKGKQAIDPESLNGVNKQLQELNTAVEQLQQHTGLKAMAKQLTQVSEQVNAYNTKIGQVLDQISQGGDKQVIDQKSLNGVKNELQELKTAVGQLQQHTGLDAMTQQLNQVSEQVKAYNTEIGELRNQISQDKSKQAINQKSLHNVNEQLKKLGATVGQLQKQMTNSLEKMVAAHVQELEQKVTKLTRKLKKANEELHSFQTHLQLAQAQSGISRKTTPIASRRGSNESGHHRNASTLTPPKIARARSVDPPSSSLLQSPTTSSAKTRTNAGAKSNANRKQQNSNNNNGDVTTSANNNNVPNANDGK